MKATPLIVATSFVSRFARAEPKTIRKMMPRPIGSSTLPKRRLKGTLNSRGVWSLKRSTTIDSVLKAKLHTTPKAYASPSRMKSPRLAMIVNSCRTMISHKMRDVVPKRTCGLRNQSGSTPSSATRLSTPLEPMIEVLTAPDRIRKPTTTTKPLSNSRAVTGPTICMARPPRRLS